QLQGVEAEASEEGLRLRVGQLHHQALTLKCWLRDQGSLHRELQASREETGRLRKELQDQLTEFQKRQHEASLAVTPLKAKVASLVQKCLERNNLITHLLQELHQRGAASPLLAERTRSMVDDVALAEYAATFLTTGVREISHPPGVRSEKADVVRAQRCSLNPEGESLLPSPPSSESRQASEANWPPWTASLKDCIEIPVPPGLKQDPWMNPAAGAEEPGFLAQHWQGTGGNPCPALHTDGLPPHSELRSPARILALHKELRQSICSNSRVNKSPLDLQV
uniref:Uncharacterized protein n=1 Tax=Loxodonta africana TaxID=9785 RepID=G3TU38_LOXAF